MKEQANCGSGHYDSPIPKPPDEMFERFIRNTEARLVTKRFLNKKDRKSTGRIERIEAR